MGTVDAQGIYQFDQNDSVSPLATTLNLLGASISDRLADGADIIKVANTSERTIVASAAGTITGSNPVIVFRADATAGKEIEYTTNGVLWRALATENNTSALATLAANIVNISAPNYLAKVRRSGNVVQLSGRIARSGSYGGTLLTVPVGFRPSENEIWINGSLGAANTPGTTFQMTCNTSGVVSATALEPPTWSTAHYIALSAVWIIV